MEKPFATVVLENKSTFLKETNPEISTMINWVFTNLNNRLHDPELLVNEEIFNPDKPISLNG